MGFFSDDSQQAQAYNEYQNTPHEHKAKLSHELIAAAASYEAAKGYEEHVANLDPNHRPPNHAKAKEIFAGLAGAFVDREVETHGLNFVDREKAKYEANRHANDYLENANYNY